MNFIILADKFNKGIKSKGCIGLLGLHKRNNIFQFQYKNIKRAFPKSKIIYIYGFDHKKMVLFLEQNNYSDLISIYNPDYEKYNYTHTISLANKYLNDDCFISFGDTIFKHQTFKGFSKQNRSQIFVNTKIKNQFGCTIIDNHVINISFDLQNYLSHIYYVCKKDILHFSHLVTNDKLKNCFIFEVINKMIDSQITFNPFINNNKNLTQNINEIKVKI